MAGALAGIRVFDLTVAEVGAWATLNLGALGADVIHIEPPGNAGRPLAGPGGIKASAVGYIAWNMNKRCITLDLKSADDLAHAHELLKTCDVFVMNMRPGVAERLGVGYETVSALNDQIVYCSITGFGEDGPLRDAPGADPQVRYLTGFEEGTGAPGGPTEGYRYSGQFDAGTGNYAAQAIMMALLARKRTGRGQRIELTMLNAAAAIQSVRYDEYFASGVRPPVLGSHAQSTAPDGAFLCRDTRYVGVSVTSEADWRKFCDVIKHPELVADERFKTNADRVDHRDELIATLDPVFLAMPVEYWELHFGHAGIPCGHLLRWSEIRNHRQAVENEWVKEVESPDWGVVFTGGPPYHLSRTPERWFRTPAIGEHNAEVLRELQQLRSAARRGASPITAKEA